MIISSNDDAWLVISKLEFQTSQSSFDLRFFIVSLVELDEFQLYFKAVDFIEILHF